MIPTRPLSARETDVVHQVVLGKSNKQIALALGITVRTVEFHLQNIYQLYVVQSRIELILHLGRSTGQLAGLDLWASAGAPPADSGDDTTIAPDYGARVPHDGTRGSGVPQEAGMHTPGNGQHVGHALLWAAAIMVAAMVGAPTEFILIVLPALASAALFVPDRGPGRADQPG